VQFPAARRKTLFGETPNTTRGGAYAPQTYPEAVALQRAWRIRAFPMATGSGLDGRRLVLNEELLPAIFYSPFY
jgi:hypothetical protein